MAADGRVKMSGMTDLLSRPRGTSAVAAPSDRGRRPLAVGAALAGVSAAGSVLLACLGIALAGWFASEAGAFGTTKDALRVGADGWLLAQGAHLSIPTVTITVVPLGLTALCAYVAYRLGRWAAATSLVPDLRTVGVAAVLLAGVYAFVCVLTAVLTSVASAQPDLAKAFFGGFLLSFLGGGSGLLAGSGRLRDLLGRLPEPVRALCTGAVAGLLLVVAASAVLVAVALLTDLDASATVLSRLHVTTSGGLLYTLVVAAVAPNAVLMGSAYVAGPGFAVGTGTLVSPTVVSLGPVPAFPLLAALPSDGPTPGWAIALMVIPVAMGAMGALVMLRRYPVATFVEGAVRGLGCGALGGLGLGVLVACAGGSVGPGRMTDVGAPRLDVMIAAMVAMAVGGALAGLAGTWWGRRHWWELDLADDEPTIVLRREPLPEQDSAPTAR
jgi:hypothetical protein